MLPLSSTYTYRFSLHSSQMFIGTFEGDLNQFPVDVEAVVNEFKSSGVTNLLIDVTNNPGLYAFLFKCQMSPHLRGHRRFGLQWIVPSPVPRWHRGWITVCAPNILAISHLTGCCRGFQSTTRANPLAQKIVNANIAQGLDSKFGAYSPDNCKLFYT